MVTAFNGGIRCEEFWLAQRGSGTKIFFCVEQTAAGPLALLVKPYVLYCIVLYLQPVLNPKSYDGARVLEASGRPMLVIGRSYWV